MDNILGSMSAERELMVLKQIYECTYREIEEHNIKRVPFGFGTNIDIKELIITDLMQYGYLDRKFKNEVHYCYLTIKGIRLVMDSNKDAS